MPKKPYAKIAIITRTKNRSLLLTRALRSVQAQTYKDFIHVIVNDGGDQKKLESVLNEYHADNRLVINNEESAGLVKALNKGIRSVDSAYVTILDDDDSWPPERLEKTMASLDGTNNVAVVVKMDLIIEKVQNNVIHFVSQRLHPESGEGEISLFKQCHKNYLSNAVVTYKRQVYDELNGYDESLEVGEDWDFGIRLLMKYDVAFLRNEKPLAFYHQRPTQKGAEGNSVHADVYQQERTINVIRNRYLRNDLKLGRFGIGYIMNYLDHDETEIVRLEGHMNYVGSEIKANFRKSIVSDLITKLKAKLALKK